MSMNSSARVSGNSTSLKIIFRSFQHRNYRLFFSGQIISLTGSWMQYVAIAWLVYRITDSVAMLGLIGFAGQIPIFLLSPFTGAFIDRLESSQSSDNYTDHFDDNGIHPGIPFLYRINRDLANIS